MLKWVDANNKDHYLFKEGFSLELCSESEDGKLQTISFDEWNAKSLENILSNFITGTLSTDEQVDANGLRLNNWLYIYEVTGKNIIYDRSMPRDCIRQAEERLAVMRARGQECFYTIGRPMVGALY